jgi:transposase-like protein
MSGGTNYVKRTQKDYPLSLKIQVVKEIESGELSTKAAQRKYGVQARSTIVGWLRKYGNFDWENQTPHPICQRHLNSELWSLRLK